MSEQQTYYFVLASEKFFASEPIDEVLRERRRNYGEQGKAIDFWFVPQPAFLTAPSLQPLQAKCPQPAVAIISTNAQFITWLKLRLEYVLRGEFSTPSSEIPDPLASLTPVN
jgi:hypothetical protein